MPQDAFIKTGITRRGVILFLMGAVVFLGVGVSLFFATRAYVISHAETDIENMLLQHRGLHHYVQRNAHPELYRMQDEGDVRLEAYSPVLFSSSYMVRNLHAYYNEEREEAGLPPLYYKMAAENPRNPLNMADEYEKRILAMFNEHPELKDYREIVDVDGHEYLYVAIPFLSTEERCLKCHGRREEAPLQLQAAYPGEGGFDTPVGTIRAIESLRAPLAEEMSIVKIVLLSAGVVAVLFLALMGANGHLQSAVAARTREINELNQGLERRVAERTVQLEEAHEALVAKEKLATLGRLTATVSHELRNPLGAIRGSLFTINRRTQGKDLGIEGILERADRSIARCDGIITELLDFARGTTLELHKTEVDVWLAGVLEEQTLPSNVELITRLESGVEQSLDREKLRRCVINLLTNACQAIQESIPPSGRLTVQSASDENRVEIRVEDTGPGIPPDQMEKVFEPLYSTKGFGVGLGLPIVRQLMQAMDGDVGIVSQPGRTVATIWFPLRTTGDVQNEQATHSDSGR